MKLILLILMLIMVWGIGPAVKRMEDKLDNLDYCLNTPLNERDEERCR